MGEPRDFDEEAIHVVMEFVDIQRRLEGERNVDWRMHQVRIVAADGDDTYSEFTIETTVPTGYLYLAKCDRSPDSWRVYPFRLPRPIDDHDSVNHPKHYTSHPSGVE
jgi:hypothetical protein